jgi:hypothetical protein
MKVHQRVLLVLLALLAIFLGVYFWDIQRHEEAAGRLFDSFVEAESQRLNTVLELDGRAWRPLPSIIRGGTRW